MGQGLRSAGKASVRSLLQTSERILVLPDLMRRSMLLVSVLACSRSPAPDLRDATCLGPADAKQFVVYVHGIDLATIGDEEVANRSNLAHIADALSLRIALPRAPSPCPDQSASLCWGWTFSNAELTTASTAIANAATACFGNRDYGAIGFSNGGYLLTNLVQDCALHSLLPHALWVVTIGSAMFHGPLPPGPDSLAGCGRLVALSGTRDTQNFDPTDHLVGALAAKHADVTARSFDGGHVVPDGPLRHEIETLLRR